MIADSLDWCVDVEEWAHPETGEPCFVATLFIKRDGEVAGDVWVSSFADTEAMALQEAQAETVRQIDSMASVLRQVESRIVKGINNG